MSTFVLMPSMVVSGDQPLQPSAEDRHSHPIAFAAFSADSTLLATASQDGTVRVWNVGDCSLYRILTAEDGERKLPYHVIAFDNSGGRLAAFSRQPTSASLLTVWDVKSGRRLMQLTAKYHTIGICMSGMVFSPDDTEVFCVADRYSYFWNLNARTSSTHFLATHLMDGGARYVNGRPVIAWGQEGVQIIDARTADNIVWHRKDALVWGDNVTGGKFLALNYDGHYELIDQRTRKVEQRFTPKTGKGYLSVFEPQSNTVVTMTDSGVVKRWNVKEASFGGRLEKGIRPPGFFAKSIAFGSGKPKQDI